MIGTSDGQQHEDEFSYLLSLHGMGLGATERAAGKSSGSTGYLPSQFPQAPSPDGFKRPPMDQHHMSPGEQLLQNIDRTKDVPLAASALHKDGQMYGLAVDKDAPDTDLGIPGFHPFQGVAEHEAAELPMMKDLVDSGMSPQDAYHEAHDKIATPRETAFVRAAAVRAGKDPDQFLDTYKQYWRDVASNSSAKETPDRHPDAHTTTYGLDESELGRSFKREALFRGLKGSGITATDATFQPLDPMKPHYDNPGGHAGPSSEPPITNMGAGEGRWFRGAEGKWRQEISDHDSKLNMDKFSRTSTGNFFYLSAFDKLKLGDILDHPELYKSYPDMKDITIGGTPLFSFNVKGGYGDNHIQLGGGTPEEIKSTLFHEVQHAIQEREGFARGGNPEQFKNPSLREHEEIFKQSKTKFEDMLRDKGLSAWDIAQMKAAVKYKEQGKLEDITSNSFLLKTFSKYVDQAKKLGIYDNIKDINDGEILLSKSNAEAYAEYHKLAGEVESRNVQTRMNMTPEERLNKTPYNTEDVLRSQQTVK